MQALSESWLSLRALGSRQHAINGAHYLGLLAQDGSLTPLGLTICDLLVSLKFGALPPINMRRRFLSESPGLAAVARLVFMQQESTKLIDETLRRASAGPLNSEQLLREAAKINQPLASGLMLLDPHDFEKPSLSAPAFRPSFVFQFKQSLFHIGILATGTHKSAGKGAESYEHANDLWKLEERLLRQSRA